MIIEEYLVSGHDDPCGHDILPQTADLSVVLAFLEALRDLYLYPSHVPSVITPRILALAAHVMAIRTALVSLSVKSQVGSENCMHAIPSFSTHRSISLSSLYPTGQINFKHSSSFSEQTNSYQILLAKKRELKEAFLVAYDGLVHLHVDDAHDHDDGGHCEDGGHCHQHKPSLLLDVGCQLLRSMAYTSRQDIF